MDDATFMRQALRLARRGEGRVEPNPMVGCLLVKAGRVVGQGRHRRFGGPHAEVEALRDAGDRARGADAYVTLEPCAHHGKTPPCADALIQAGVRRVVIAAADPSPDAGGGAARLRDAGVDVELGVAEEEARQLLAPFLKRLAAGLPYVILKWAMTVDGAIATAAGHSRWISNPRSRKLVHRWRGRVDAVMVGAATLRADDPLLTARDAPKRRIARRVVVDPNLTAPLDAKLVQTADQTPTTIAASSRAIADRAVQAHALRAAGVDLFALDDAADAAHRRDDAGLLSLTPLLHHLAAAHHAVNVLVEGGATLAGALLRQRLVDELRVFIGPRALGDGQGLPPLQLPRGSDPPPRIDDAHALRLLQTRRLDDDLYLRYAVQP